MLPISDPLERSGDQMATWSYLAKYRGYYTSSEIPIHLDGDGALTQISWKADVPPGTSLMIQTCLSYDGIDWGEWKTASNGAFIPDVHVDTPLNHALMKFRVVIETESKDTAPLLEMVSFYFEPVLVFDNKGDSNLKPEIWITKIGNGDFSIVNTSRGNEQFKFTNLIHNETVYVDNEYEHIESSLPVTYRYKDFNDQYLDFDQGQNILRIDGDAKFQFRYSYKFL